LLETAELASLSARRKCLTSFARDAVLQRSDRRRDVAAFPRSGVDCFVELPQKAGTESRPGAGMAAKQARCR
jgi:hypothetical protein